MSHRAGRSHPGWPFITLMIVVVVASALFVSAVTRTDPTPAATIPTATVDTASIELAVTQAEADTCRRLVASAAATANRLDHQFHLHHEAHRQMVAGKISRDERNRVWTATLAARAQLSPLLRDALKAVKAENCQ